MATLDPHEDERQIWQQPGSHPGTTAADLRAILGANGEAPWGLFLQQEALTAWAKDRVRILARSDLPDPSQSPGVEHEVLWDHPGQRVIKITHPGTYGHTGSCRWGKLELVQAKPLEYLDRLSLADELFDDGTSVLGVIPHKSGPRIVTAQPVVVGEKASTEAIVAWMEDLGFTAVGRKTYWHASEHLALFDLHPGNVLRLPSDRLCPIDVVPVRADAAMTAFMQQRLRHRHS